MADLQRIPGDDVDPRIARHLEPGEAVLWQGKPRKGTFVGPGALLAIGFCLVFGVAAPLGGLDGLLFSSEETLPRLVPALILVPAGLILSAALWDKRDGVWVYAITDRRLLSAKGDTLHRAVGPDDIRGFGTWRDAVYWKHARIRTQVSGRSEKEKRFPGFHGMADPEAMLRLLQDWRESFSLAASAQAAAFVEALSDEAGAAPDAPAKGARRIRHPATGLVVDVPSTWETQISLDRDGPLEVFGVTLLKRFIREGEKRPYTDGEDWTALSVRGAPECGLDLRIVPAPLAVSLDMVLEDPWSKTLGLEVLKTTPDLKIDEFKGFSLVRQGAKGATVSGFGEARGPVAMRQAWLAHNNWHLEIMGLARLDQPHVQRAVDAIIDSIRLR